MESFSLSPSEWLQKQLVKMCHSIVERDGGKLEFDYAVFDACKEFEGNNLVEFTLEMA